MVKKVDKKENDVVIRLKNVAKHYFMGEAIVKAVDNVDVVVHRGDFVAVMGPSGSGKCVVGDTQVIMGNGVPIKIKDLEKKEDRVVYSLDKRDGKVKKFNVSNFYKRKEENLLEIKTSSGREIIVSEDHPFFTLNEIGFKEIFANNLKQGVFVAIPRKIEIKGEGQELDIFNKLGNNKSLIIYDSVKLMQDLKKKLNFSRGEITKKFKINPGTYDSWFVKNNIPLYRFKQIVENFGKDLDYYKNKMKFTVITSSKSIKLPYSTSNDLMELYGLLSGDGWIDRDGLKFSNFDKEIIERYNLLVNRIFGIFHLNSIKGRQDHSSRILKLFFENIFSFPLRKKSSNLFLPDFVFKCPDSEIACFIKGLFDCDSYVDKKKKEIQITLASKKLIKQLQFLLLRFGIVARYSEKIKYATNTEKKTKIKYYSLSLSGYENLFLYNKYIGFNLIKKKQRLKQHLKSNVKSNTNVDVIPCGDLIRSIRRNSGVVLSRKIHDYLWAYESKKINPTKESLNKVINIFKSKKINVEELVKLLDMNVYWDKVVEVNKIKKESLVYDITVPNADNFLADNFIIHNSTAMNLIGSLDVPTDGSIFLDGTDISTLPESDLAQLRGQNVGFIFQQFNLIPTLTVKENIMLPMNLQNLDELEREDRVMELLKKVELLDRADHYPNQISGGQQQRVAIARALANDPEVILADEPTGNLDSKTGLMVMDFLKELNKEGKTIIMVTHDPNLANTYADIVYSLKDGKVDKITKKRGK